MKHISFFLIIPYLVCGCLPKPAVAPSYFRKGLDPGVTFWQVYQDPGQYVGKNMLLGGIIAGIRNHPQVTEIEIIQKPLDKNHIPLKNAYSGGKFLALYRGYLDRLIYAPGRLITIAGTIEGKRVKKRYGSSYTYPLLLIHFYHLWPSQEPYYYPPWFQPKKREEMPPAFWNSSFAS